MRLGIIVQRKIPTFQRQYSEMGHEIPVGQYIPNKLYNIVRSLTFTGLVQVVCCKCGISWKGGYGKPEANNQITCKSGSLLNQTAQQSEIPHWGFKVFASICTNKWTKLLIREIHWASSKLTHRVALDHLSSGSFPGTGAGLSTCLRASWQSQQLKNSGRAWQLNN